MQKIVKNFKGELIMDTELRQYNRREEDQIKHNFLIKLDSKIDTITNGFSELKGIVEELDVSIRGERKGNGRKGLGTRVSNIETGVKILAWIVSCGGIIGLLWAGIRYILSKGLI